MLPEIKRFAGRLLHPRHGATVTVARASSPAALGEMAYHCGDHWQNLLASPMDARHYVLEDWGSAAAFDNVDTREADACARSGIHVMRKRQA
jgi:hypothetical protein